MEEKHISAAGPTFQGPTLCHACCCCCGTHFLASHFEFACILKSCPGLPSPGYKYAGEPNFSHYSSLLMDVPGTLLLWTLK